MAPPSVRVVRGRISLLALPGNSFTIDPTRVNFFERDLDYFKGENLQVDKPAKYFKHKYYASLIFKHSDWLFKYLA